MFRKMKMTHRKIDSAFYLSLVPFVTTSRRNVSIPESCMCIFSGGWYQPKCTPNLARDDDDDYGP